MRIEAEKNVLVLRQWADLFQFSKFRNVPTQNNILKFLLLLANVGCQNCLAMVNIIISIFPLLVFLKQLFYLSSFLVIHYSKKTSAYIIFQKLKNIDYSYIVLKTLNNINFSPGDPCCEINFGKTKSLKIARSFCAKVFKDHLNQAICYLASLKAYTSKVNSWKTFFNSTKWLKAYETGYSFFFINNVLKPERVVCSKCQHCSSIKMTSLKLAESGQFFFHAIIEFPSVNQQRNIFDGIDYPSM